ncbi:MAG: hypothetical protein P1U56_06320 [Saprospiraceae bacterium]|nr:hypothetical protein [Saprospiraceae bacterium]
MKKYPCLLVLLCSLSFHSIQAQEKQDFRLDVMAMYGLGFGVADNSNEPDYNFRTQEFNALLNFDFGKLFGFGTGMGFSRLSGNGFNSNGDFFHRRTSLRIPVLLTMIHPFTEHFEFYANGGFFWEQIRKDEFQYLSTTVEDVYEGSGIGAQFQIGLLINLPDHLDWVESRLGIVVGAQVSGEYDSTLNTQDLGDIFTASVVYSYIF